MEETFYITYLSDGYTEEFSDEWEWEEAMGTIAGYEPYDMDVQGNTCIVDDGDPAEED